MSTLIQQYLRDGNSLDALQQWFDIRAKRHREHPNLVLLKYSQLGSPFHEPIVRECRGIVLDEADDWRIVARAFDKFFNHGEGHAATLDWSTARVQEKLDGSLCVLYWYADRWHVATTGTPDASGSVGEAPITFADLFWQTLGTRAPHAHPAFCFYFELMTPLNRIVVQHADSSLVLLGARSMETQEEIPADVAQYWLGVDVPTVRSFGLQSFDEIAASFDSMSPLQQEGYVVVDAAFRRVKVKHPGYVALHHARDGMSTRAFVDIARSGEVPEVIAAFPEFKPRLDDARERYEALVAEVEADYARHRDIAVQKDFAIAIRGCRCPSALFAVRAGKAPTVRDFLATYRVESLVDLLGLRDAPAAVPDEAA